MRARLLISKENGWRSLFVPEAHIQIYVHKLQDKYQLNAFRTDGLHGRTREEAIPTVKYLEQAHQFTAEVDVPEHIVKFAVESERKRQEAVGGIEQILMKTVRTGDRRGGFKELMEQVKQGKLDPELGEEVEQKIAEEAHKLIVNSGGLQ